MITLEGLSPLQKAICETLWSFETMEQVVSFRNSLPKQQRQLCDQMLFMITLATIDEEITTSEDCEQARKVLDAFRL